MRRIGKYSSRAAKPAGSAIPPLLNRVRRIQMGKSQLKQAVDGGEGKPNPLMIPFCLPTAHLPSLTLSSLFWNCSCIPSIASFNDANAQCSLTFFEKSLVAYDCDDFYG